MTPDNRAVTALQHQLARAIVSRLQQDGLRTGDAVNQLALASDLGVSRTPIRAALDVLRRSGVVEKSARGFQVGDLPAASHSISVPDSAEDGLIGSIARDRHEGRMPDEISEAELMRRYAVSRTEIVTVLRRLADLGLAIRKPGFGWRFLGLTEKAEDRQAAYEFRLTVEPAALRLPGYTADPIWLYSMRKAHERFLSRRWKDADSIAFFEMNAAFHLGLVGFSGNRFFIQATEQQNSLRRLRNYSWRLGAERVAVSCADHLGIIGALEQRDAAKAADLMTAHLQSTAQTVARQKDQP